MIMDINLSCLPSLVVSPTKDEIESRMSPLLERDDNEDITLLDSQSLELECYN